MGWASRINQDNTLQTCLQANLIIAFAQWRFLFPENSSLCQADKNETRSKNTSELSGLSLIRATNNMDLNTSFKEQFRDRTSL